VTNHTKSADEKQPTKENRIEVEAGDSITRAISAGFVQSPHYLRKDGTLDARHYYLYGVLLGYVNIGAVTGQGAVPGRTRLADDCGCSPELITDLLKTLRAGRWVSWQRRPNATSLFTVYGPGENGKGAGPDPEMPSRQNRNSGNAYQAEPEMPSRQPINNNVLPTVEKEKKSIPGVGSNPTHAPASAQVKNANSDQDRDRAEIVRADTAPQRGASVNTSVGTSREEQHAYWTDPAYRVDRLDTFDFVAGFYPNGGADRMSAMAAWRQTINTRLDDTPEEHPLLTAITCGVQWYARQVAAKGQENFVIGFPKWIREEKWNDAPATVQKGQAA